MAESSTEVAVQADSSGTWWLARCVALVALLALIPALVVVPAPTLSILWGVVVPLVPISLLFAPHLWRAVCPLATLNMLGNGLVSARVPGPRGGAALAFLGVVLLAVLVPARHFVFNADGPVLAATIGIVGLLAFALGAVFKAKSGFCNGLCPVLPVERLYGQRPVWTIERSPRCGGCQACSGKECIDVAPGRAVDRLVTIERQRRWWIFTPFGAFAAAFPGFVLGYFLVPDASFAEAGRTYLVVLGAAGASFALIAAITKLVRVQAAVGAPVLAAVAATIYYGFAAPGIARAIGAPDYYALTLEVSLIALVAGWLARTLRMNARARRY